MPVTRALNIFERKQIEQLLKLGLTGAKIALRLGRGKNTVNVEIRRNGGPFEYNAEKAQKDADKRAKMRCKKLSNLYKGKKFKKGELAKKVEYLEMQIEILFDAIKELKK